MNEGRHARFIYYHARMQHRENSGLQTQFGVHMERPLLDDPIRFRRLPLVLRLAVIRQDNRCLGTKKPKISMRDSARSSASSLRGGRALRRRTGRAHCGVQQTAPSISLIHHDAALEGEVPSYSEIKAAVDPSIISDPSLIPSYEEIRRFDDACNFAAEQAANKKKPFKLDTIRDIYAILAPDEKAKGPCSARRTRSTGSTITTSRRPRRSRRRCASSASGSTSRPPSSRT